MSGVDWAIAGILLLSVAAAVFQGFFYEVFALAGVVIGYLLAAWEYPRAAARLQPYVKDIWVADLTGFLVIFFGVVLLAGFTGRIARWVARQAGLNWIDRLLGGAFGLARGVVTVCVLVLAVAAFAPGSRWLENSQLAGYFLVAARGMSWAAPGTVRAKLREGALTLRRMSEPQPGQRPQPAP
jgi:membrane protein required for colicin V production